MFDFLLLQRLAELGDFSENAAYQMAKGKLRGINQRILELDNRIKHAIVIKPTGATEKIQLGNRVTVEINGLQQTYLLLGSTETNPLEGIISHNSPIGNALLGHRVGDAIQISLRDRMVSYKIIKIE